MTRPRPTLGLAGAGLLALLLAGCMATPESAPAPSAGSSAPTTPAPSAASSTPSAATSSPTPTESPVRDAELTADLIEAAWSNDVTAAAALIKRGADVNAQDSTGQSAYLIATSEGHTDLLDLTLDRGADVASLDSCRGTGLIRAAERGHADIVARLIRHGTEIDHVNDLGWTALHESLLFADRAGRAARGDADDYVDTVRVIVASGGDVTRPDGRDDMTPARLAREHGLGPQAQLLEQAAELDKVSRSEANRRLLTAAESGDADRAALALRQGAELETRNHDEQTPLVVATKNDRPDVARLLLHQGADPDAKDSIEDSAFLYAGAEGLNEILALTLEHDADVASTNRFGGTALIPASEHGHVKTVQMLLDAGVPVNHVNTLNWTALHEAIVLGTGSKDHVETVRLLITGGADVTIPDGQGASPRDLAAARGYDEIVALIEAAS